jgi:hypothetical protein
MENNLLEYVLLSGLFHALFLRIYMRRNIIVTNEEELSRQSTEHVNNTLRDYKKRGEGKGKKKN